MRESEEEMQEMDKFSYLGVMISMGGGMGDEVTHRVLEGRYVWGSMGLWQDIMIYTEVRLII